MATAADVVVIGAGHNGLVCAAYLAAAGMDVLVLERRPTVGGCASTVDALGTRVNICNCDHSMIRASGVIEELDLAAHGLRYVEMDPVRHYLTVPGGDAAASGWWIFPDAERTLDGLARTHPSQVGAYRAYLDAVTPVARLLLHMTATPPTPGRVARRLVAQRGEGIVRLLRLSRMAVGDAVRTWFDGDPLAAPVCATGPAVWGLPPQTPGTGLGALGYALAHLVPTGRPVGGSGALTDALAAAIESAGGRIRCGATVERIDCEGPAVRGVTLAGGEELRAAAVVCAADPRTALVSWLADPPASAHRMVDRWRVRSHGEGYESKLDAVVAAPPRWTADHHHRGALGLDEDGAETTIVTPGLAGISAAHAAAAAGGVAAQPIFFANVPDLADPTVAPAGGGHTFSLEVLFTPWRLRGGVGAHRRAGPLARRLRRPRPARVARRCAPVAGGDPPRLRPGLRPGAGARAVLPRRPAGGADRQGPGADPVPHAGPRPLPHRCGHLPGCWGVGRQRAQRGAGGRGHDALALAGGGGGGGGGRGTRTVMCHLSAACGGQVALDGPAAA